MGRLGHGQDVCQSFLVFVSAEPPRNHQANHDIKLKCYRSFFPRQISPKWYLTLLRLHRRYHEANMHTGGSAGVTFDALQAFWPALQARAGGGDSAPLSCWVSSKCLRSSQSPILSRAPSPLHVLDRCSQAMSRARWRLRLPSIPSGASSECCLRDTTSTVKSDHPARASPCLRSCEV